MGDEVATYGDARDRVNRIKSHVNAAWDDIKTSYQLRDWVTLGYADWDAMCESEFDGARIALPIGERQQIVADLRSEGMSTRAIGSALGVHHSTVAADISTVGNPTVDTVTGLDGKTRPATVTQTTRTTEATKVEQVVDLDTGEILNDTVTAEVWEAEQGPSLEDALAADPEVRAANVRRRGTALLAYLHHPHPDATELAAIDPDLTEQLASRLSLLAAQYRNAMPRHLSAVKES
jgi:predicted transcriptional regulator